MSDQSTGKTHHLKCGVKWNDHHFQDFLDYTSINGITHLFRGKSKIKRIIWAVIFLGAVIGLIFMLVQSIQRFVGKPTATTIVFRKLENGTQFPAITVCNVNSRRFIEDELLNELLYYLFDPLQTFNDFNTSAILDKCYERRKDLLNETFLKQTIWNYMLRIETMDNFIHYCGYSEDINAKVLRCEDQFEPVLTPSGLCFTFNSIFNDQDSLLIRKLGSRHGLKFILNINQEERPGFDGQSGIQVIVHDHKDIARPSLYGIGVPPGRSAAISVNKRTDVDETSEVGCTDDMLLPLLPGLVYSQFACVQNQLLAYVASNETCGCIIGPQQPEDGPFANTRECTIADLCCALEQYQTFDASANCPLPCTFSSYNHHVSYTNFPSGSYLEELVNTTNKSEETIVNNYLSVHVFMEDLQVTTSTTQYTYSESSLLADFGGHMGLFLGISIISLIEIVVLALDELKKICINKKVKAKIDTIDAQLALPHEIITLEVENSSKTDGEIIQGNDQKHEVVNNANEP